MAGFEAIIFDLDGTLLDSVADIAAAMNQSLAELGCPGHDRKAYIRFIGDGVGLLARRALPEGRQDEQTAAKAVAGFRRVYAREWHLRTRPYPGVMDLLTELDRRGLPQAILSNKPHDFTVEMVAHFFPDIRFTRVLGHRPDLPPKPDPAGALKLAGQMAVRPERIIFVGDSQVDIQTGLAAGMTALGVDWGFRTVAELKQAGAQGIISDAAQVLEYF